MTLRIDHGPQHLAAFHLLKGLLHLVQVDGLRDEAVKVQTSLQVEVYEHREVTARQAIAVPGGLERPPAAEDLDHRQFHLRLRVWDPHEHNGACQVARIEGLFIGGWQADRLDRHIDPVATGHRPDGLDRILL